MKSRHIIINFDALAHNFATIQQKIGSSKKIMAVLKANAYGHGLIACATFLQKQGANYFGVAFIEEAIQLRDAGITIPILVLGSIDLEQISLFLQYNIDIMATSNEAIIAIDAHAAQHGKIARVHLKIDTGLGRIGVRYTDAEKFFVTAISLTSIEIIGVASHFATSGSIKPDDIAFMHEQYQRYQKVIEFFPSRGLPMPLRHLANSGAIIQFPESYFDMVRPGIMMYGVYPSTEMKPLINLKPVLSLHARIVFVKKVLKSETVSYERTWKAPEDTKVITLPIGYGDGYTRALSNKGFILLNDKKYAIVGNVCMDQIMVNIGQDIAHCHDIATFIGRSGGEEITVNYLADLYGGRATEFLALLNSRIGRHHIITPQE